MKIRWTGLGAFLCSVVPLCWRAVREAWDDHCAVPPRGEYTGYERRLIRRMLSAYRTTPYDELLRQDKF